MRFPTYMIMGTGGLLAACGALAERTRNKHLFFLAALTTPILMWAVTDADERARVQRGEVVNEAKPAIGPTTATSGKTPTGAPTLTMTETADWASYWDRYFAWAARLTPEPGTQAVETAEPYVMTGRLFRRRR